MTGAEAAAADSHDHDEVEDIELDHILGFRVKEMANCLKVQHQQHLY